MSLEPQTWAVVATIKAPTKDILTFAAHYLQLGAVELYLFLDFPDPVAEEHLRAHSNICVTNTGPDYWSKKGRRPHSVERRQIENIKTAIDMARSSGIQWLGHFDADEFLHVPEHAKIKNRLVRIDDDVMCARALPVEYLIPDTPDYDGPDQFKRLATPLHADVKSASAFTPNSVLKYRVGSSVIRLVSHFSELFPSSWPRGFISATTPHMKTQRPEP